MEFYDVINERKSIKKFKSDTIDSGKVERILQATMMSPSWKNNTSYKLILVDDVEEKRRLSTAVENRDGSAARALEEAPMVAVMVGDPALSGKVDNKDIYLVDSAIAMEHLILAATAEGYGTCWVAALDEDKVKAVLNVPRYYKIVAMTPIGAVDEKEQHYPEKNEKNFIFHNKWDSPYKQ